MNKGMLKNILIVLLVSITIFSVFKYLASLKEKYDLLNTLNQIKERIATLEKEKQNLSGDLKKEKELEEQLNVKLSELKGYLNASKKRLTKLFANYGGAQKTNEELSAKFSILKSENTALIKQRNKLNAQVTQIAQENDSLKAKLSSIVELRKAIKELKRRAGSKKIVEGNRGFLIKDGKCTYPTKVKIEVIPAPPTNNARDIHTNN